MRYIEVNLDHQAVGSGWRRFLDLTGPQMKDALLFYPPTLTQFRVPKESLRHAKEVRMTKALARTLAWRLKRNLRNHKRLGLRTPTGQVKAAVEKIKEEYGA